MNFITLDQLNDCLYKNISRIPRDIDMLVGIPRSGTMVANILALYLNLPYTDLNTFCSSGKLSSGNTRKGKKWIKGISDAKRVLLVDDSISSGAAMSEAKKLVRESKIEAEVLYLAVYTLRMSCKMVDFYFEICEQPRMFEWNYMHHWALEHTCIDIDGVLCEDPAWMQNDDGRRYREFLINARPKILPTQKVGCIVTCRLEKYRRETQEWLERYDIEYGELCMLNVESGRQRLVDFDHGKYKAEIYKKSKKVLFIESDYAQAVTICKYSNKAVFCVASRRLITPDNLIGHLGCIKDDWRITGKRAVKKLLGKIDYVK